MLLVAWVAVTILRRVVAALRGLGVALRWLTGLLRRVTRLLLLSIGVLGVSVNVPHGPLRCGRRLTWLRRLTRVLLVRRLLLRSLRWQSTWLARVLLSGRQLPGLVLLVGSRLLVDLRRLVTGYLPRRGLRWGRSLLHEVWLRAVAEVRSRPGALIFQFEILFRVEGTEFRRDITGEHLDCGVVLTHVRIIEPARSSDPVFRFHYFFLRLQEVLVALQLRVLFLHHDHAANRARELTFGLPLGPMANVGVTARLYGSCPRLGNLHQGGILGPSCLLDHMHHVFQQVVAALQFNINLRPRFLGQVAKSHQLVV